MSVNKLKVVFCWHMHQPDYRGPDASDFQLPWVYLHAIKDYADMASHIEQEPKARCVVNFAPVLLEQIDEYIRQLEGWLERGERIRDPVLAALAGPGLPIDDENRKRLIEACLKANERNLIARFPAFKRLAGIAKHAIGDASDLSIYLNDRFLVDLLVWYHLAWIGEYTRENDVRIAQLEEKGGDFSTADRKVLISCYHDVLVALIPRYRRLAEQGKVELSVSPYAHPILPLLLDINSARDSVPNSPLPRNHAYPDGEARSRWHIEKGRQVFEQYFGFPPKGCWPSEGAICESSLDLLQEAGFDWVASGQNVLANSLRKMQGNDDFETDWVHRPYTHGKGSMQCFFRDDGLSDLIGFTYSDWHAEDAVGNLIDHLQNIANANACNPDCVVSIIMDGENAWEYYPRNGLYLFQQLYKRMADHPRLELTTFSDAIKSQTSGTRALTQIVAGSWVYGTLSTWIGDRDKNRGWDMLIEAKQAYDAALASQEFSSEELEALEMQLATCEGSDWFWWFGDYNPAGAVSDFEQLFRSQLVMLYQMLGLDAPDYLSSVFARGGGDPSKGGVMRKC